jgi:hypothetical protein
LTISSNLMLECTAAASCIGILFLWHIAQVHPCEAQVATLPHYLHPSLPLETSEVRAQYRNPYQVGIVPLPTIWFLHLS